MENNTFPTIENQNSVNQNNPNKNKTATIALIVCLLIIAGGVAFFLLRPDSSNLTQCGNGICGTGENRKNCPQDCQKPIKPVCGNKICETGEDSKNCLQDCPAVSKCGDNICDAKELANPSTCPNDCVNKCGNKICETGEDSNNCPQDCPVANACGDGACNSGENCTSCQQDCGSCPAIISCGDGVCSSGETCSSCQQDCGSCPPIISCGDGVCSSGENCTSCAQDCGNCPTSGVDVRFGSHSALTQNTQVNGLIDLRARTSREWIQWGDIETAEGQYNWANMDLLVRNANNNNIDIIGFFRTVPSWARVSSSCTSEVCAIKDMSKFKNFAKAVAQRYDGNHGYGKMEYIEILNEVTTATFFDLRNTNYQDWLINGYQGVKEGNPNAKVLIGGFVNPLNAQDFVTTMLRDYSQYYDIVSFHVYESDTDFISAVNFLKSKMTLYNVNKPMWITEMATIPRYDESDPYKRQAEGVIKRYSMAFGNGVERVLWWPFIGAATPAEYSGTGTSEKIIGLVWAYPKGSGMPSGELHPRPAYNTYKLMTSKLSGFSSVIKITNTQYKFVVNGKNIYVLWCDSGTCSLPSQISGTVKVTDYLGNAQTKNANQITLTSSPVFVE